MWGLLLRIINIPNIGLIDKHKNTEL